MPFELTKKPDVAARFINYLGPSMRPTFRSGDQLQMIPYKSEKIRSGDVIAFLLPGEGGRIIHRVVQVTSQGVKTRGDNNNLIDPWVLDPAHIQGRIAYARRGGRRWRVAGGFLGRLFSGAVRTIHLLDGGISASLRPAYQWMGQNGVLSRILHPVIETRIVSFNRPGGSQLQLLWGRHVIGWLPPAGTTWRIRRPFRLFIREPFLPQSPK